MSDSWVKRKLRSWLGVEPAAKATAARPARTVYGGAARETLTEKQAKQSKDSQETLRMAMLGQGPGWWASDHAEEANHFTGPNYCAVHAKAKQGAQATCRVYQRTPVKPGMANKVPKRDEVREKAAQIEDYERTPLPHDNEWVRLLEKPNPRWSAALFRYQIVQQLDLTGSALIWKVKNRGGGLAELWVIPTALARPQMPSVQFPEGAYWVTAVGLFTITGGTISVPTSVGVGAMAGLTIDARDVHSIRWPHPYLLADGMSPLAAGSVQTDLAEEMDSAAWAAMNNAVDPSIILSLNSDQQADDTELDRIEKIITANRGGSDGKGKIWVIQDCEPKQVHRAPSELDYANSRPQAWNNVLAIQGMAPPACGIPSETGTYSAYYVQLQQSIELTVQPELDLIAGEFTRMFQAEGAPDDIEVCIEAKSFNDPDVLEKKRAGNVAAKSVTINEDRKLLGLEPVWWGEVQVGTAIGAHELDDQFTDPMERQAEFDMAASDNDAANARETGIQRKPMNGVAIKTNLRQKANAHMLNGVH